MLREILTSGFVDKNINLSGKKSISPKNPSPTKSKKSPSFKQLNKNQKEQNSYNKPILEEKIEKIKKRPDYLLNQNNESTNPTINNNKQILKSPNNINNINLKDFYNQNEYSDIDELEINNNNLDYINNNKKDLNKKNNFNEINHKSHKIKKETDQNIQFNMTMLTPEGIDKVKLLGEYISQIKENSNKINEIKIQELQSQKEQLEYNVKYLSNNIILTKKKYNDNIKAEKNLLAEKEKVGFDQKKANKDAFSLHKELPNNRVDIEIMKNRITQAKEETKNINNYLIEIERQTREIQDEIKKINVKISYALKEKDKTQNEINSIKKKNNILRNKIIKAENSANEFLFNVAQLAKSTQNIKIK